jgi:hypothetical protein
MLLYTHIKYRIRPHAYVESATVVCQKYQFLLSCFFVKSVVRGDHYTVAEIKKNNNNNRHNTVDDVLGANYPR